jgi:peptide/nickel transport system permease protein
MYRYVVTRLLLAVPTLVGAAALVFVLMRLVPGDICVIRLGAGSHGNPGAIEACRQSLGLDNPLIVQFLDFLGSFFTFDFGTSMWSGRRVAHEIGSRLPVSLQIALMATVIAVLIAIPLGTISALKENTWLDHIVRMVAIAGIATPSFWLGIMSLVLVLDITYLATGKAWMPPIDYVPFWQDPLRNLSMVLLPAITVGYRYSAVTMRLTRSAMLEVMREDYIRTARAKGLPYRAVLWRHALRNAMIPVLTILGLQFAFLLAGTIIIENVFYLPGLGRLVFQAITQRDLIVVESVVMLLVAAVIAVNLVVDLSYAVVDPRLRSRQ